MKHNLQFDFTVNKENNTIQIKREFDAGPELVWKAWTTAELLDQWWGPKPWRAETKTMDFREGGYWLYAMVSPEGERHWSKVNYISITSQEYFKTKDGFSDENGELKTDYPQNIWESQFSANNGRTLVSTVLTFDTLEDLENTIEMGFKEGFTMGLNQLDELLTTIKNK